MIYSSLLLISFCNSNEINYILLHVLKPSEAGEGPANSNLLLISFLILMKYIIFYFMFFSSKKLRKGVLSERTENYFALHLHYTVELQWLKL